MSALIILITDKIQEALNTQAANIEVTQVFGREVIVDSDGERMAVGNSAYVEGEPEEFRKLLKAVGELWTSTNPMLGNWEKQMPPEEAVV